MHTRSWGRTPSSAQLQKFLFGLRVSRRILIILACYRCVVFLLDTLFRSFGKFIPLLEKKKKGRFRSGASVSDVIEHLYLTQNVCREHHLILKEHLQCKFCCNFNILLSGQQEEPNVRLGNLRLKLLLKIVKKWVGWRLKSRTPTIIESNACLVVQDLHDAEYRCYEYKWLEL